MPTVFTPIELVRAGARAAVLPYAAHVTSWITPDPSTGSGQADERLFVSASTAYTDGKAIRGGVPVIFPQFSDTGPLPRHGFARTRAWDVAGHAPHSATLALRADDATRAIWPHPFAAELTVSLDDDALTVALAVENTGDRPLAFTGALHTYLRVRDVAEVAIEGLRGARYRDQTAGGAERVEERDAVRIVGEVDRVYLDVPNAVTVREPGRALAVSAEGFRDVVVWNPGEALAAKLADLEPGGWRHFVCVEAAAVARPVEVAAGARWTGQQRLALVR